jgi:hypothetical protein
MELQKVIILLALVVVLLVGYKMILSYESFDQLDICDYDSPDPSKFCSSIKKGCTHLKHENIELNTNLNQNCSVLPTNTKDLINTAINCDDTVNKIVMNEYVQKEVCAQIKNFPDVLPDDEIIPESNVVGNQQIFEESYYLDTNNGYSPF